MRAGRAVRNRKWRKRRAALASGWKLVNRWLWRATALWCWIHLLGFIAFRRDLLELPEKAVSLKIFELLVSYGFSPSNPTLFPSLLRVCWILFLARGRALFLVGFAIYVAFAPLAVAWTLFFYVLRRVKNLPKPTVEERFLAEQKEFAKATSSFSGALVSAIAIWLVFYGQTGAKGPLVLGLTITGLLFFVRLYRTTLRVALAEIDESGLIARISLSPYTYLLRVLQQLAGGLIKSDERFFHTARTHLRVLRWLRRLNAFMRGKRGKRRAALLVLFRYSFGLTSMAALGVLFWSFFVRLQLSPTPIRSSDALLASAARMIPGVAGPEAIKVSNFAQTGAALTAWFVFVLYAGPMASMFPVLLDRYIKAISEANEKLLVGRRLIYRLADSILRLEERIKQNPSALRPAPALDQTPPLEQKSLP